MSLGKAPQPHSEALEADLLEVCTAGAQGGDQQLVQVLGVGWMVVRDHLSKGKASGWVGEQQSR